MPSTPERHARDEAIAVIGIGCQYPGARGPRELWENVLARRQQFRRMPDCRLPLGEYHDPDSSAPDKTYGRRAALMDGFAFDWGRWRIPKATAEGTDVVQWLALEIAAQALADAGFDRETVPRERTGVLVGNTLTGEHTRANTMRTRWPFVRRALMASAEARGLSAETAAQLADTMEGAFKSVFPPVTEDTLAGGLANTVAGRICNAFDLHGGGYVVDGACSSSLLAVCTAAGALATGDLDLALAGGVDVSLDTFELIGFAKTGALSPDEMRVYDRRGNGFTPGEGCGMVVLKRLADAERDGDTVYAVLRGWGVSSDGKGGLTAPSVDGQARALRRAYDRAGYPAAEVDFIEGHGTGTRVGDRVELEAIAAVVGKTEAAEGPTRRRVGVTSFKSIVGHTKAAAGVGAFIKTVIALNRRVIPPTAGCDDPNDVFGSSARSLYPVRTGEVASPSRRLRAGVSAMGFGGINSHVTLESPPTRCEKFAPMLDERALLASRQETEVFVFDAATPGELRKRLTEAAALAEPISAGELTDLAAELGARLTGGPVRAAVVAGSPDELAERLRQASRAIVASLADGETIADSAGSWWLGRRGDDGSAPAIGFLLPGQGSQQLQMARVLVERHPWAQALIEQADRWLEEVGCDPVSHYLTVNLDQAADRDEIAQAERELARTEIAQPALCLASLLYVRHLGRLGVRPSAVLGHSLGELTAFHLAGAFDAETLIKLAGIRGRLMAEPCGKAGAMASLTCSAEDAYSLLPGAGDVVVANRNAPSQTVVSGSAAAVDEVIRRAESANIAARRLNVSGAFHSPLMQSAADALREDETLPEELPAGQVALISSMTGKPVAAGLSLPEHFARQLTSPVDFIAAVGALAGQCDELIEVGPGRVLSGLAGQILGDPNACVPIASRADRDRDLNRALGRLFVAGADVQWNALYANRLIRPFVPADERLFIDNPCERPLTVGPVTAQANPAGPTGHTGPLEAELLAATGLTAADWQTYLDRRRPFLCELVRADAASLAVDAPPQSAPTKQTIPVSPAGPVAPSATEPNVPTVTAGGNGLEPMMLQLAAERTGFPVDSLAPENRLLDDLNLDSIKAAELVAEAAKRVGVAGQVDPSQYANASLAEIAAALAELTGRDDREPAAPGAAPAPAAAPIATPEAVRTDQGEPTWVRNFAVEYVETAA